DSEKLQKILARTGIGSRRQIEELIREGRVKVNGQLATIGDRATAADKIEVDGRPVRLEARQEQTRVLVYNKPEGEICTRSDPEVRPTGVARVAKSAGQRWIAVGR